MEKSLHQASNFLFWTLFQTLFLLANVLTTSTGLRVLPPTGWYVDDRNRNVAIRFQCFDEGRARVTWRFKGKDLSASSPCNRQATRTVCGPLLLISKFQADYAGLYTCRNPSTSREVHVPLGVQPEFVDPHLTDYIAAEGERVDLDCSIRPSVFPPALVKWQKREGSALKILGTAAGEKYTIEKAQMNDSGMYICKVTNDRHKSLATRSKYVILYVYVPAKCNFSSARNVANNVSATVKLSGTPQPRFSAVHPWHQLASDISGLVVATRSGNFSESSPQLIGNLTQVVINGKKRESLLKPCNLSITISPRSLQICLFIRFTPNAGFCDRKSKSPFNSQAKELIQQLIANLYVFLGCYYEEDIRAVFVETKSRCPPFRIIVTIRRRDINASSHCFDTSKINSWLYNWNSTFGTVEIFKNVNGDQQVNLKHCSKDIEKAPDNSSEKCHRIFYCSKHKKDRTVCLVDGYFHRVTQNEQNFEMYYDAWHPRMLCLVIF